MGFCQLHGWWARGGFAELPWEGGREQEELGKPWIISYITAHIQGHSFVSGFAMLSYLSVVSGLAEGCFGSQNHCVGLLAEKLGREKLERMTQSRLSCRQWEQHISPFHIQNLTSLTSKSWLLYLLNGVKFHLLPVSEKVRSVWETNSCVVFFTWGWLICAAGRVVWEGSVIQPGLQVWGIHSAFAIASWFYSYKAVILLRV